MNLEYKSLLDKSFDDQSKVWIYQSSRLFSLQEALQIEDLLKEFVAGWKSHGTPVKGSAYLFFGQFIILMADETNVGVGGCSTDASVRFIKDLGQRFGTDFFNRTNLAFLIRDKIQVLPMSQVQYALDNGFINADTLYFNNLVQTKQELEKNWIIPVKNSWLSSRLTLKVNS